MNFCIACSTEQGQSAKFCPECGSELTSLPDFTQQCLWLVKFYISFRLDPDYRDYFWPGGTMFHLALAFAEGWAIPTDSGEKELSVFYSQVTSDIEWEEAGYESLEDWSFNNFTD